MKKRYVKDYVSDGKGRYQYLGKRYVSRLSEEERKREGLIQIGYSIVCLLLVFLCLSISCRGSRTVYIVIPLELTLICLFYDFLGSLALRQWNEAEKPMEQKDYDKMYQGPMQALTIAMILYVFSLGGQIIGLFMDSSATVMGDVYFCMLLILLLALSAVMWNRQRQTIRQVEEKR